MSPPDIRRQKSRNPVAWCDCKSLVLACFLLIYQLVDCDNMLENATVGICLEADCGH